jgi:two-component system sensor histidine kinase KdpD
MNDRPTPSDMLRRLEAESSPRGRLKVFLGYAAGVGKTYAMLEAAHQRKAEGVDVAIGYVETHQRAETDQLAQGLEILQIRRVEYHGLMLAELNVEAVVARRPALVLVDEFAHTNAPGSRNLKRYQDVEEILDAGIDVYTTLNIQHLESLNDVVAQVTGVMVRETIPDVVLDQAAEIEVIDLPPDELLNRLREGKVYIPDQAARAIEKFFRKGNLTALREISLRRAAARVDDQMRFYMETRAIPGPWPAAERLLACISANPLAEKLVRTTRRLADQLDAEWYAVHVQLVSGPQLGSDERQRAGRTLQLAEQLGGKSLTLSGRTVHEAVLDFARKHNVTKIVVGKPLVPRWQELIRSSIVNRLLHASGDIDVYVISSRAGVEKPKQAPRRWPFGPLSHYLAGAALVTAATALGMLVRTRIEPANLVMLYLAVTVVSAVFLGRGPAMLTAVLGVLAFDFFLINPYYTLAVSDSEYLITFAVLFVVSMVVSSLTAQVHEQADAAIQREAETSSLHDLARDLASAADLEQITRVIVTHVGEAFNLQMAIFLPQHGEVGLVESSPGFKLDPNDLAVAGWTFAHDAPAGRGTDTLPGASLRCLPLKTANGLVGVLGIRPHDPECLLTPEQRQVLAAFVNQSALGIERALLAKQAQQAELSKATENLQTALLNSVSHDLRSPLVAITGALSALDEDHGSLDDHARRSLVENARSEADRLNRLVGNLLHMTRIQAGALRLTLAPSDLADVISSSLEAIEAHLEGHEIQTDIEPGLPLVNLDFVLIVQVLVNLLDNAIKYSPPEQAIEIYAFRAQGEIQITVEDRGPGIPSEDLERVFDKFFRVQRPGSVTGTGLGLSICRGIVEAHGGSIHAENRPLGGTRIVVDLPVT